MGVVRKIVEKLLFKSNVTNSTTYGGSVIVTDLGGRVWRQFPVILFMHPWVSMFAGCAILGSIYCMVNGYASPFQRFGALVGAAGVMFEYTASAARRKLLQPTFVELILAHAHVDAQKTAASQGGSRPVISAPSFNQDAKSIVRQFESYEARETRTFFRFEVILIALGTMQATFGDWLVNLVHCGGLAC